jgi:Tfp pilus assembly protein FimT
MRIKQCMGNRRGFSLVEMVYVFIIIGLLLGLTMPSFGSYVRSRRLAGSTNELMADLHYVRSLAVSKRRTYQVQFNASDYAILETATGDTIRARTLPKGVSCAATADPSFYAWGLADPSTITISSGSRNKAVDLSANGNVSHY